MSMTIGKEAREAVKSALERWMRGEHYSSLMQTVGSVLDRCTDAPEVGLSEADLRMVLHAYETGVGHGQQGRGVEFKDRNWGDTRMAFAYRNGVERGEANSADAPEAGLPEGWPWTPQRRAKMTAIIKRAAKEHEGVSKDTAVSLRKIARWLEPAEQKEKQG